MFEASLEAKLKTIFGLQKVSYADPGESKEQECLFVNVENSWNTIKDGKVVSKVTANAVLFGNADKLPFGFFSKAIHKADNAITKDFFFFDLEANTKLYDNVVSRSLSFVYFCEEQYNPEVGSITSVNFEIEES